MVEVLNQLLSTSNTYGCHRKQGDNIKDNRCFLVVVVKITSAKSKMKENTQWTYSSRMLHLPTWQALVKLDTGQRCSR